MATLYPPARRLVQQRVVLDFRQRLGSSSAGCCESPGIVCHELCRASLLRRHERGRHKASKSSVGPVIPRAAKRGACYSKSTSPLSNVLDNSIRQRRATGNRFLPTAFNLVTVSSPLGLTCSPAARLRQILCAMTPLPQKFRDLAEEFPSTLEVRRIAQLTPSRQDRHWRFVRAC